MTKHIGAYNSLSRMSDDDYAGALLSLGQGVRLVVNPAGTRYALQRSGVLDGQMVWAGASYATLSKLVLNQAAGCEGLAVACEGLPDAPCDALPELQQMRQDVLDGFAATDWRREDYPRMICQDGNLRLVVDPSGSVYRLQWVAPTDLGSGRAINNWATIKSSAYSADLLDHLLKRVYSVYDDFDDQFDPDRSKGHIASALQATLESVPPMARDGQWPNLPNRPEAVNL